MKKIAVVQPGNTYCGIHDHAVFIDVELRKGWKCLNIPIPDSTSPRAWKKTAALANAADIILIHYEYSLFHSIKPYRNIFLKFVKSLGPPVIVILHDLFPDLNPQLVKSTKKIRSILRDILYLPFFSQWSARLYGAADHYIVHTPALLKHLQEIGIQDNVTFFEHPIPKSLLQWSPTPTFTYSFVTPGFIKEHKGYLNFLDVISSCPDWNWLISGGPQTEEDRKFQYYLQMEIEKRGLSSRIVFSGYQPRQTINEWLLQAEWAVFPYNRATSSGATAWAIGLGIPIMATDIPTFQALAQANAGIALLPHNEPAVWPHIVADVKGNETRLNLAKQNNIFAAQNSYAQFSEHLSTLAEKLIDTFDNRGDLI